MRRVEIKIIGITTAHDLAKELLSKDDDFITVTIEDREYSIETIKTVPTHCNYDDGCVHKTIVCKYMKGNLR